MAKYFVDISASLVASMEEGWWATPEGWRLIERWGPRGKDMERWIVEDDYAGEEFEGYLITPVFRMTLIGEGPDYITEVSDREIVPAPY